VAASGHFRVTFLLLQKSNQKKSPRKPTLSFRTHVPPFTLRNSRSALFADSQRALNDEKSLSQKLTCGLRNFAEKKSLKKISGGMR
jgi:hypothetical protein